MTIDRFLKSLVPPLAVMAWKRLCSTPAPDAQRPPVAVEHTVTGGVLKGHRLVVAAEMPSYREMLNGTYDPYLVDALPNEALAGRLLLDIGAHIGFHALSFAARYPEAHVVAFEPNPANVERAKRNLSLSPDLSGRIELIEMALSNVSGKVTMNGSTNVEDQTSSGSYITGASKPLADAIYQRSDFKPFTVECRCLDDLAAEKQWKGIAVLKIDVEGAEHLVLQGARWILERDHPLLLIEIHSVVCMMEVLGLIGPLGYRAQLLHEDGAGRCFIAAR